MTTYRRGFLRAATVGSVVGLAGCGAGRADRRDVGARTGDARLGDGELVLATSTSTYDSGLLDALHPTFEARYGLRVKTLSKGTGAALRTAADGDADVVLAHAREAEDAFLRAGHGVNRRDVMYNDFVVLGPAADPAGVARVETPTAAFRAIAAAEATFLSRGDESGTHQRERALWEAAGVEPGGRWYRAIGQGQGDMLVQASETGAYVLADRGTFRSMRDRLDLVVLLEGPLEGGPASLRNAYGVISTNPGRHGGVNYEAAMAYVGYLTGPDAQARVGAFAVDGEPLFVPSALEAGPDFDQYVPEGG